MFKIVRSPYLNKKSSDFLNKIWYTNAGLELDDSQVANYKKVF